MNKAIDFPETLSTRVILSRLVKLLIKKGIMTKEEWDIINK